VGQFDSSVTLGFGAGALTGFGAANRLIQRTSAKMALAAMQQPAIMLVTSRNTTIGQMRLRWSFLSAGRKLGERRSRESQCFLPRTVAGSEKIGREESRLPNPLLIAD
jgi:hypothetical protein